MPGSKTQNSVRKPASIKDSHKGGGLWSGSPPLWEAVDCRHLSGGWLAQCVWNVAPKHRIPHKTFTNESLCELMININGFLNIFGAFLAPMASKFDKKTLEFDLEHKSTKSDPF